MEIRKHYHCEADPNDYMGKKVVSAKFESNAIFLKFPDGKTLKIIDDGQNCCEKRYISTDDNIKSIVGANLVSIKAKSGPPISGIVDDYSDVHETRFVEIATDKGFVTFTTHNEHNGYYGGFDLQIEVI